MPGPALSDQITEWTTIERTVETNASALAFLQEDRADLQTERELVEQARLRNKFHRAQAQLATRELELHRTKARDIATRMRNSLRGRYGISGEQLVEFGMQPRRFNRAVPETLPKPPEMSANPSQAAASETDGTT
jgi:hypothetical protein